MTVAWLLNAQDEGITTPVTVDELEAYGVYTRQIDPLTIYERHPTDEEGRTVVERLIWCLGYQGQEEVALAASSEEVQEHVNVDEQMRIVMEGLMYVDVRDLKDRWVRIKASAGDVVVLPPGLYYRLIPAEESSVKMLQLFRNSTAFRLIPRDMDLDPELSEQVHAALNDYKLYLDNPPMETIFGPANNSDNILIKTPRDFDTTFSRVKEGLATGDIVVLLFKGAPNRKTNKSWCPPCVIAEPMVSRAVESARKVRRVVYVQCNVERSVYLGNPNYAYRTHHLSRIFAIPLLLVLQQSKEELVELVRQCEPGEQYESWVNNI